MRCWYIVLDVKGKDNESLVEHSLIDKQLNKQKK